MPVELDIASLLIQKLQNRAAALAIPVWWENTSYTPDITSPYLRQFISFEEPFQAELGDDGRNHISGFMTIQVCYPIGKSIGAAFTTAGEVMQDFKRGEPFVGTNFILKISKCGIQTAIVDENWYKVPVRFWFYTLAPN